MVYTRPPYLALTYRIQVEGGMYIFVTRDETVNELNIARSFQGGTFIEGRDQSSIYSRKSYAQGRAPDMVFMHLEL